MTGGHGELGENADLFLFLVLPAHLKNNLLKCKI